MFDIIVIGAGPAGMTAALYARRAEKSVLVIEKSTFGGQITHSPKVENYPGFQSTSGNELAAVFFEQIMAQGAEIELDTVTGIEGAPGNYTVVTEGGRFEAKSVIIATGSKHRTLGIDGEERYTGEGISYCAVCDGAFYKGRTVAVIGGGNSALVEAVMLSDLCKKVYVIQNLDFLTGEKKLQDALFKKSNVEFILSTVVTGIIGNDAFEGLSLKNEKTGEEMRLAVDGTFVAIGQVPENEPFKDRVTLNDYGYIVSDESCKPEGAMDGIFVAGDCRTKTVRQVTTATADGAAAALLASRFVDSLN